MSARLLFGCILSLLVQSCIEKSARADSESNSAVTVTTSSEGEANAKTSKKTQKLSFLDRNKEVLFAVTKIKGVIYHEETDQVMIRFMEADVATIRKATTKAAGATVSLRVSGEVVGEFILNSPLSSFVAFSVDKPHELVAVLKEYVMQN